MLKTCQCCNKNTEWYLRKILMKILCNMIFFTWSIFIRRFLSSSSCSLYFCLIFFSLAFWPRFKTGWPVDGSNDSLSLLFTSMVSLFEFVVFLVGFDFSTFWPLVLTFLKGFSDKISDTSGSLCLKQNIIIKVIFKYGLKKIKF